MKEFDQLLQTLPASDPWVCEALVREYYSYIYRLAYSILGDPDEAEDASQETFIHAFASLDRYQVGTNLKSWLSTIAVNLCRDQLRRHRTRQTLQGVLQTVERITRRQSSPEEAALHNEQANTLWQAVKGLDEKHRLPIILRFVHGLPAREIAEILHVSEGTIHSRLHYAIRKLQVKLKDLNGFSLSGLQDGGME